MAQSTPPNFTSVGSVEVGEETKKGETRTRRMTPTADRLVTQPFEGIEIVPDVIEYGARTYGTKNALGWRDVVDIHEEEKDVKKVVDGKEVVEKKKWKYFQLSDYKYLNFVQVKEAVSEVGRGLVELGLAKEEIVNVYAQTRCVSGSGSGLRGTMGRASIRWLAHKPHIQPNPRALWMKMLTLPIS